MKTPDEDEEFDRDAYQRGLEGDEDILFPSKSNEEGIKEYDKRQAENAEREEQVKRTMMNNKSRQTKAAFVA